MGYPKEFTVDEALEKAEEFSERCSELPSVSRVLACEVRRLQAIVKFKPPSSTKCTCVEAAICENCWQDMLRQRKALKK